MFHTTEKELSKLEKDLGVRFVSKDDDPFGFYRDKWVDIRTGTYGYGGVYRGTTTTGLVLLMPHSSFEEVPEGRGSRLVKINTPEMIRESHVLSMEIPREEYIKRHVHELSSSEEQYS